MMEQTQGGWAVSAKFKPRDLHPFTAEAISESHCTCEDRGDVIWLCQYHEGMQDGLAEVGDGEAKLGLATTRQLLEELTARIEELEGENRPLPDDAESLSHYIDSLAALELLRGTPEGPWLDDIRRAAAILRGGQ
jgi:hypothetical protein